MEILANATHFSCWSFGDEPIRSKSSKLRIDRLVDIGQDSLVVRGYDERGVMLWGPQVWQTPTPGCFEMPLTVQQVLLERFCGEELVSAELLPMFDKKISCIDLAPFYTIPSGASASILAEDGALYYVIDIFWFPPYPPSTKSLDGSVIGEEIEAQSILIRRDPSGQEWNLLLNHSSVSASLLPAPEGGIYLQFRLFDLGEPIRFCQVDADGTVRWQSTLPDGYAMGVREDGTLWVISDTWYYPLASSQQAVPNAMGTLACARPRARGIQLKNPSGCDDGGRGPRADSLFFQDLP